MSQAFIIEPLEGRTLLSCDPSLEGVNLDAAMQSKAHFLGTEVGGFLSGVQSFIYDRALAQPLPLIGAPFKGLKGTSKDLLQPLINKVSALTLQANELTLCPMYDKLQGAIGAGATPASAGGVTLAAATGNTIDARIFNPLNWSIGQPIFDAGFDMTLRGTLVDHTFEPNFDLGLPALGLKLNGGLKVDLTYEVRLVVGLDQNGFYLETGLTQPGPNNTTTNKPLPEIKLMVDVTAPGLTFSGSLGFLKLSATDHGTHLTGELDVDLQDGPDADTKLRVPELSSAPQLIKTAKITGSSHLDLLTSVDFGSAMFPSLGANLVVDWDFKDVDLLTLDHLKNFGSLPSVAFNNVTLDLGSFMGRFLGPVLKTMNDVLEPVRPVLDGLRTRVPLLSDVKSLAQEFDTDQPGQPGYGDVSILEVLNKLDPNDAVVQFFTAADQLDKLIGGGKSLPSTSAVLNLGGFGINGDMRTMTRALLTDLQNAANTINSFVASIPPLPIEVGTVIDRLKNPSNFGSGKEGFRFPILDNKLSVFGIFLGQPVTLVTYTTPRLSTGPIFDRSFPIFGPIVIRLLGGLRVDAQFSFGFDTFGLASCAADAFRDPAKIANGLYVSDRKNPDGTGDDVDEVVVQGSVNAGVGVNVGFASAMVGGGINGVARLNLNDPNNDGKVRFNEILDLVHDDPLCLFDATGRVYASLLATGQVFGVPFTVTFASLDIAKFAHHCEPTAATPLPDLVASTLDFKSNNPNNPRALDYSLDVTNRGGAATTANANATIYLSDDDQITTSDLALKVVPLGMLADAEDKTFTGTISLPNLPFPTDNQYYLGVIVDDANAIAEADETNNVNLGAGTPPYSFAVENDLPSPSSTNAAQVQVRSTPLAFDSPVNGSLIDETIGNADMDVFQFTVPAVQTAALIGPGPGPGPIPPPPPPPPPQGKLVGLDIDAKGGANTYLRLYDASWNLIASNDNGLAPAEATSAGGESYLEENLLPGTYYAVVSVAGNNAGDPRLLSGRSTPTFGAGPYVLTLLSDPHALPDVVATAFTSTGTSSSNLRFTTLNILNQGTADAPSFWVRYYVSEDPTITTADTPIAISNVGPIAAGGSATVNESIDLGAVYGTEDSLRTDNEYFIGVILNDAPPPNVPIVEANTYNDANNGLGIDRIRVSSEADLPSLADGVNVVARTLASSTSGASAVSDIGDEFIGRYDLDVFKFTVNDVGAQARIDIDPLATFASGAKVPDAYLRLYDSNWTLLAQSTNQLARGETGESPAGAYIEHNFAHAGTYYAVVSSAATGSSDPRSLAGRAPGNKGGYSIELKVFPFFDQPSDLGLNSFTATSPAASSSKDVTAVIVNAGAGDANLFAVNYYVSDDPTITTSDTLLKSTIVQHIAGSSSMTLSEHVDLPAPLMTDNQYYVGVLLDPDGRVFENGSDFNNSASFVASADADLPSPADGATVNATDLTTRGPDTGTVGDDEWTGPYDLDTYRFTASPGQSLALDANSTRSRLIGTLRAFLLTRGVEWTADQADAALTPDNYRDLARSFRGLPITLQEVTDAGNLDAFLRLYDADWNPLASSDDATSPTDTFDWKDPYLSYTFAAQGTYYAVVGSSDAAGNSPLTLAARRAGTTHGQYSIALASVGGGSVYGVVFEDQNADGARAAIDPGLPGATVFVDANNNGLRDPGEPAAVTDAAGRYAIGGLADRAYTLRHLAPAGFTTTAPSSGAASVEVFAGERPPQATFGDARLITLTGSSFNDANADGRRDPAESPLEGRLVFIDLNDNALPDGADPRALTGADGALFFDLLPGHYVVREDVPADWRATTPPGGVYELGISGEDLPDALQFGSVQTASISGVAFDDANADGAWDSAESPLAGRRIFIDANGNGTWDAGEQTTLTGPAGEWSLRGLLAGPCRLAQEIPTDWQPTAPAGGAISLNVVPGAASAAVAFGSRLMPGAVVGRHVFYNNSALDGGLAAAGANDDNAIDAGKQALLPGQAATFANYTNYTRGINGIMIDVTRLAAGAAVTSNDFAFAVGGPAGWMPLAASPVITRRTGAGVGGSDRITFTFADGSVRDTWLRVTVLPTASTRLETADVFYFGNLVGEAGDNARSATVGVMDTAAVRRNYGSVSASPSKIRYDFNKDGFVNALDLAAVRANAGQSIPLLAAPPVVAPASAAPLPRRPTAPGSRRSAWGQIQNGAQPPA